MCSADDFITLAHVPSRMMGEDGRQTDIDHEEQMVSVYFGFTIVFNTCLSLYTELL